MGFLDFSALMTKIAAAAKKDGIELSQEEIDQIRQSNGIPKGGLF